MIKENSAATVNPRKVIWLALNKYFRQKTSLKLIINDLFRKYHLTDTDRRFISNIIMGTVRHYMRFDFVISIFSKAKLNQISPEILNILRMAVFQKYYMDRVPDYSIVNESVELAKSEVSNPSAKFVNAVLRKICSVSDHKGFFNDNISKKGFDDSKRLSIANSFPEWIIIYWKNYYGDDLTRLLLESLNINPVFYLRKNSLKKEECGQNIIKFMKETGNTNLEESPFWARMLGIDTFPTVKLQEITSSNLFKEGCIYFLNIVSQIAVKFFLNPLGGQSILDICAAPGGKTAYISEIMTNTGKITSVDLSKKRLEMFKKNINRLSLQNVTAISADATKKDFLKIQKKGLFDRILLDLPCSALGTISKNPDAKYNHSLEGIYDLAKQSFEIMENCCSLLKPGGNMVFYTCTLSPVENQEVIERFLNKHKADFRIDKSWTLPKAGINLESIIESAARFHLGGSSIAGSIDNIISKCFKNGYMEFMPFYFQSEGGYACSLGKIS